MCPRPRAFRHGQTFDKLVLRVVLISRRTSPSPSIHSARKNEDREHDQRAGHQHHSAQQFRQSPTLEPDQIRRSDIEDGKPPLVVRGSLGLLFVPARHDGLPRDDRDEVRAIDLKRLVLLIIF